MSNISKVVEQHRPSLDRYESLYKHFHSHPELSFQEKETAATIHSNLAKLKVFSVYSNIGGTGIAAVLKNGSGKTVLLRADIDGLPVKEKTGLPYASKVRQVDKRDGVEKPTMHACGHDMHITSLLAAAELLVGARDQWQGTLILCFQPAEEIAGGARAMVEDGLYKKVPVPDVCFGAHVMPFRAGSIGTKRGLMACAADSFKLAIHGRSGHASQPHRTIDPIVLASSIVLRLQTIVSREVAPSDHGVVTVSAIHAGDAENIIPARADMKLNVRTTNPETRERVLASIKRIIRSEAEASNAPEAPELTASSNFPFTFNDDEVTAHLERSFSAHFEDGPHGYIPEAEPLQGSEDFGILATSVDRPSNFFTYGGVDPEVWDKAEKEGRTTEDIPVNHSAYFAPIVQPTLRTAVDGYAVAALTWLVHEGNEDVRDMIGAC